MPAFYLDVDGATHQTYFDANTAANLRLVALTMRDTSSTTLYSAAWIPSDGRNWVACHGVTEAQLLQFYSKWQAQGMEMKLVTSSETLFAAVMEATGTGTQFVYDLTDATLASTLNSYQTATSNFAPRSFAIYGAPGNSRRYAVVFEPCQENWAYRLWDTDTTTPQAISAYFNDLRYRPTLLVYSPDSYIFAVFRDNSIGTDKWTTGNAMSAASLTATYNSYAARGMWPLSLSVNSSDTFACVMATTETPLPRQFTISGSDLANLAPTIDPLVQNLMQGSSWNTVGKPRAISIAVAYKQRLMFAKAYTWADSTYPVTRPISSFRLASCSKPITSMAIGRLLQDGVLTGTDTVAMLKLSPAPGGSFPSAYSGITVDELRSHRSGLQPVGGTDSTIAAAYGHPTPISIYEWVAFSLTNATIDAGFPSTTNLKVEYQNINFALLGLFVRNATNGLYTHYVRSKVFSPLGLTRPSVGASLHAQRATLEVQHHSSGSSTIGANLVSAHPPLVGSGYGTGVSENFEGFEDWSVSTVDYVALLAAIGVASGGNHPILNSASVATMFTKIDPTGAQDNFTLGGLFWGISPASVTVYAHNGGWSTGGLNIASWVMSRSDGVSAAVFMNMDDPTSGQLYNFVWQESNPGHKLSGQFQKVLDTAVWPTSGDLFPNFGITTL
jgi:CubicO group peptidase (beta-lactamase class C family)